MIFKPGDKVICTTPIDDLVKGGPYEVAFAATLKTETGVEELIHLEGKHFGYMAFRFKLAVNNDTDPMLQNMTSNIIGDTVIKIAPPDKSYVIRYSDGHVISMPFTYNHVDEGMVANSASKNDQGKPDLSLISYPAMVLMAEAMMLGEKKYGRYNYTKGHKVTQLMSAILRHSFAYLAGEEKDPIDGQSHLGSIMAGINMLVHQRELGTLVDDRFKGLKDASN